MGFFGVWWAWMNFTWFASAHDADDVPYRLLTLVQMAGALVYAAGVTDAVEEQVFTLASSATSSCAPGSSPSGCVSPALPSMRRRALRYAGGVAVVQLLWLGILVAPSSWTPGGVPRARHRRAVRPGVGRARRRPHRPPYRLFHPEHIEERYGLFTIIVLGETILSATIGIGEVATGGVSAGLLAVAVCGLLLAFGAWWLYFDHPGHLTPTPEVAIRWGYTHVVVFASLAALGPGVHVAAEAVDGAVSDRTGALAVAVPDRRLPRRARLLMVVTHHAVTPMNIGSKLAGATAILALGLLAPLTVAVVGAALVVVALVATMVLVEPPRPHAARG